MGKARKHNGVYSDIVADYAYVENNIYRWFILTGVFFEDYKDVMFSFNGNHLKRFELPKEFVE